MTTPTPSTPRKTLGITGITINAMALVAPGTFAWMLYQAQATGEAQGLKGIWLGVISALLVAFITALSLGELARRYSSTNLRSAYHFVEQIFRDPARQSGPAAMRRFSKFVVGWASHVYYWVYPGLLIAFIGIITDYLLRQLGYSPRPLGQVILALAFAAFTGFLALRGITGSTSSSIILNTMQLASLVAFSIFAILFRVLNPLAFAPAGWTYASVMGALFSANLKGVIFQAALGMLLMVGFESVTSLGAQAKNPRRDIPIASIMALVIQGIAAYFLVYFASGLAFNNQIAPAASSAPLGDLALQVGDAVLGGNGFSLMFVVAFAVCISLIGALLTATNNGVRISFSMGLDAEMPDLLGILNPKYATPYFTVVALCVVSAVIGSAAMLGGLPVLLGLILASNIGAFLLYAILCVLTVIAFYRSSEFHILRHGFVPVLGLALNLFLALAAPLVALSAGGITAQAAMVALAVLGLWLVLSILYYFMRRP